MRTASSESSSESVYSPLSSSADLQAGPALHYDFIRQLYEHGVLSCYSFWIPLFPLANGNVRFYYWPSLWSLLLRICDICRSQISRSKSCCFDDTGMYLGGVLLFAQDRVIYLSTCSHGMVRRRTALVRWKRNGKMLGTLRSCFTRSVY